MRYAKGIPYSTQFIDSSDIKAVVSVLKSRWLTQGPNVEGFEKKLSTYTGSKYAIAVSNGTAALEAAFFAAGVKTGDEVISSPLTFAATVNAALWLGAKPVFCDIDPITGNIDPLEVEKKITKKTKILVAVDYSGMPANLSKLKSIAHSYELVLLEDAAQALGASYLGKRVGSISDLTTFSFHPVKTITTAEGGAIVTNNYKFFERMMLFRNHGIKKDNMMLEKKGMPEWYFEINALGHNLRMTEIQAALGISQLSKSNLFLAKRRKIANYYLKELSDEDILLPHEPKGVKSSWHLFPIRLINKNINRRDEIFRRLRDVGVLVQAHHIPVYLHPYYRKLGFKKGLCPKAETYFFSEISLPIYPSLTSNQIKYVVKKLKHILHG